MFFVSLCKKVFFPFFSIGLFFLSHVPSVQAANYSRNQVGLNVHWALGGFGYDHMYDYRLQESRTEWVREHFYNEVFSLENPDGWYNRYDEKLRRYQELGIKVVGMLAYGPEHGNFYPPEKEQWEQFIRTVVGRYGDRVDVWEVWNEPDSKDYLILNNPETFGPILEQAYPIIKELDPGATVLIGGLASPNSGFLETLYRNYQHVFDAPAFHVYSCRSYVVNGNLSALKNDLKKVKEVIDRYRPTDRAWVTEVGCTTNGTSDEIQRNYLRDVHETLFSEGWIARSFVYNFRKRETENAHENGFGILSRDLSQPTPAWKWYQDIQRGPYDQERLSPEVEQEAARELKEGLTTVFNGKIPPAARDHWPTLVDSYLYGQYPVKAIKQALVWGGYTVHSSIPFEQWRASATFQLFITREKPKKQPFAYGKPRLSIFEEQSKAQELKQLLRQQYSEKNTGISGANWDRIFKAYAYGGYPIEAIVRAPRYGWKTAHPDIGYDAWKQRQEYKDFINKPL